MSRIDNHEAVLLSLRQIIRAIDLHSKHLVQHHGLTGPQLLMLRCMARLGCLSAGALAREVSLSQATVTGVLDRLEARGLVTRRRGDEDRRKVMVAVTTAGLAAIAKAPPLLQEQFISRFRDLPAWEQTLMLSSVQRLAAMMQVDSIDVAELVSAHPLDTTSHETMALLPPALTAPLEAPPARPKR